MRWKKKEAIKDGQLRTIGRFLLFPKTIDGETRWLEYAFIVQKMHKGGNYGGNYEDWLDYCWLDRLEDKE